MWQADFFQEQPSILRPFLSPGTWGLSKAQRFSLKHKGSLSKAQRFSVRHNFVGICCGQTSSKNTHDRQAMTLPGAKCENFAKVIPRARWDHKSTSGKMRFISGRRAAPCVCLYMEPIRLSRYTSLVGTWSKIYSLPKSVRRLFLPESSR